MARDRRARGCDIDMTNIEVVRYVIVDMKLRFGQPRVLCEHEGLISEAALRQGGRYLVGHLFGAWPMGRLTRTGKARPKLYATEEQAQLDVKKYLDVTRYEVCPAQMTLKLQPGRS